MKNWKRDVKAFFGDGGLNLTAGEKEGGTRGGTGVMFCCRSRRENRNGRVREVHLNEEQGGGGNGRGVMKKTSVIGLLSKSEIRSKCRLCPVRARTEER